MAVRYPGRPVRRQPPLPVHESVPIAANLGSTLALGSAVPRDVTTLVVVPVRSFDTAKGRLAGVLSDAQRTQLARRMAAHVVAQCRVVATVAVVSGDPEVLRWAATVGAVALAESPAVAVAASPLNAAVAEAAAWATSVGAHTLAVVHGDLPLLDAEDVATLVRLPGRPGARIAPDRAGTGTNAVSCAPPDTLDFAFGPGSMRRHRALAHRRGVPVTLLRRPGLECDVDTPEDLRELAPSFTMVDFDSAMFVAGLRSGRT